MKKLLLLVISLLSLSFWGNAQNYFVDGTTWTMEITPHNPMDASWKETVSLIKDGTADGQVFLMIGNSTWGNEDNQQIAKIKTEDEKVFFSLIEKPELGWFLLYDFGLKLNDECTVYSPDLLDTEGYPVGCELKCTEIIENNVEFDGFTTMGMKHSSEYGETSTTWIKGIGDTWGVLTNFSLDLDGYSNPLLIEVKNGDEIIYSQLREAQNYFVDGTTWTMDVTPNNPMDANWIESASLLKDNTTDDPIFLMVYNSTLENKDVEPFVKIKTEGEKVFFSLIEKPEMGWFLLYDFGLKLNDECTVYSPCRLAADGFPVGCELKCTEIIENNVEFDGFTTMGMTYSSENGEISTTWINGIGDTWGVLTNFSLDMDGGSNPLLLEVKNGEEIIYANNNSNVVDKIFSDEIEFFVADTKLTIQSNSSPITCYIFNTEGILISQSTISKEPQSINLPQKGIYILKMGRESYKIIIP